jgi:hypothetical protein
VVRAGWIVVAVVAALGAAPGSAGAALNAIQIENVQQGTTSWQQRVGGDIGVYGTQIGAAPGDAIALHVSTPYRYRIVVYRLGWYGGAGARQMACLPACDGDKQGLLQRRPGAPPALPTDPPIRAGWAVTDTLQTDASWTSGYYLVEAVLTSGPDAGRVATTFFILRELPPFARPGSTIVVQVPVNTWEAYNSWGGRSLYNLTGPRMYRVSFQRPFGDFAQSPFWWEIQLVRFLEREGYDVSYQTDVDTDTDPSSLLRHRLVVVAGHDEYWTKEIRNAFDNAVEQGTNVAFMGANEGYWRVRYEDNRQTIFAYKSLYDPEKNVADKTAMFREIGNPECELEGAAFQSLAPIPALLNYTVTPDGAADPWLKGTGLKPGDTLVGAVSREHDKINPYPMSCFHPGLKSLLHYDGHGVDQDGDATRFTAPSGARVFNSVSFQFNWLLDDWRSDGTIGPVPPTDPWKGVQTDPRVQQLVRNALDDLTRPAPPLNLAASWRGGNLTVTVGAINDPRHFGFVAGVRSEGRWNILCKGFATCTAPAPIGTGPIVVGAVVVDKWFRHSSGTFAVLQRQR